MLDCNQILRKLWDSVRIVHFLLMDILKHQTDALHDRILRKHAPAFSIPAPFGYRGRKHLTFSPYRQKQQHGFFLLSVEPNGIFGQEVAACLLCAGYAALFAKRLHASFAATSKGCRLLNGYK